MEILCIELTRETPQVLFNGDRGRFVITGKSYPENVNNFFQPIFEYIELYKQNPKERTVIDFNWLYYNTATSKMIMKMIMFLKDVSKEFEINWYYKEGFDLIAEKGEEIKEVLGVNLNIIKL